MNIHFVRMLIILRPKKLNFRYQLISKIMPRKNNDNLYVSIGYSAKNERVFSVRHASFRHIF